MRKSSCTVIAALAVSLLGTSGAHASMPRAAHLPGDVTATECIEGGGVEIIISARTGGGTGAHSRRCARWAAPGRWTDRAISIVTGGADLAAVARGPGRESRTPGWCRWSRRPPTAPSDSERRPG
ncbi:hypothetical protein SVIOM342S_08210 [Streptomyces violaceorubidus]